MILYCSSANNKEDGRHTHTHASWQSSDQIFWLRKVQKITGSEVCVHEMVYLMTSQKDCLTAVGNRRSCGSTPPLSAVKKLELQDHSFSDFAMVIEPLPRIFANNCRMTYCKSGKIGKDQHFGLRLAPVHVLVGELDGDCKRSKLWMSLG